MVFKKRFSKTLCAVATFTIPKQGMEGAAVNVEWQGKAHRGILARYERWMVHIHQRVCDQLNIGLMYIADKHEGATIWSIRPGIPPERIERRKRNPLLN